jgi:hypothetical protein
MLTFLGLKVSYETLAFLALFLVSEVVGNSKLKENSIVQLLLNAVNSLKPLQPLILEVMGLLGVLVVLPKLSLMIMEV